MEFNKLNLKTKDTVNSITVNDIQININQYLPVSDKYDLIITALQKAKQGNIYNDMLVDVFFNMNIIYMYTDLEFADEELEDEMALYDKLESNGIIEEIIAGIGQDYINLVDYLDKIKSEKIRYETSTSSLLQSFIQDMPKNAAAANEIVENFNPEKFQQVVNFATAANGNRPI